MMNISNIASWEMIIIIPQRHEKRRPASERALFNSPYALIRRGILYRDIGICKGQIEEQCLHILRARPISRARTLLDDIHIVKYRVRVPLFASAHSLYVYSQHQNHEYQKNAAVAQQPLSVIRYQLGCRAVMASYLIFCLVTLYARKEAYNGTRSASNEKKIKP